MHGPAHVIPRFGWGRYPRTLGYVLLTACGLVLIAAPAPAVRASTAAWAVFAWAGFLIVGGVLSAIGAGFDRWPGEYVGLWPIMTAFAVWTIAALAQVPNSTAALAFGLLLGAITSIFFARWRHVARVRRALVRVPERVRDEP